MNHNNPKPVIGKNVAISIGKRLVNIPAKVDTGADSSSIWASKIRVGKDGLLRFALFGEGHPLYSGKVFKRSDFKVALVRSTNGNEEIRYRTSFLVKVQGKRIRIRFNLSDRSKQKFPVLIGRRSISRKFLVDVEHSDFEDTPRIFATETKSLNKELSKDPRKFYKKYHGKKLK